MGARALRGSLDPPGSARRRDRVARVRPLLTGSPGPPVGAGILWSSSKEGRCRSRRSRRSGWTASWCRGTTPRCTCSPTPCTTAAASSRASGPTRPPRGAAVWHLDEHLKRLFRSAKLYHTDIPYSREAITQATKDVIRANGLERLLRPPARAPRLRRDGREPAGGAGQRRHRGVAVGRLPRRGGARAGRAHQGQQLAPQRAELAAGGREGHRAVHQLRPREGGEPEGRLRRGDHAERGRLRDRRLRARTCSSSGTAC